MNPIKYTLPLTAIVIGLALSPVVSAASSNNQDRFNQMDANGDGTISKQEFLNNAPSNAYASPEQIFSSLDTNSDDELTKEEMQNRQSSQRRGRPSFQ